MQKVIFSAFLILAPEPYCQILLILHKLAEFSRFLDSKYNQDHLLVRQMLHHIKQNEEIL